MAGVEHEAVGGFYFIRKGNKDLSNHRGMDSGLVEWIAGD